MAHDTKHAAAYAAARAKWSRLGTGVPQVIFTPDWVAVGWLVATANGFTQVRHGRAATLAEAFAAAESEAAK
jgi:hypothetical protein